jgi:hypothetical protein
MADTVGVAEIENSITTDDDKVGIAGLGYASMADGVGVAGPVYFNMADTDVAELVCVKKADSVGVAEPGYFNMADDGETVALT